MIRQRFRNLFTRKHSRPNNRLETLPTRSARDHMADIDGPLVPTPELAPRLHSSGPRSVPNGSTKTKKGRRHSGHGISRRTSNRRRSGSGHPVHRQHQRAKAGRKANVQRLMAAKK
jgi:hypothetical protein